MHCLGENSQSNKCSQNTSLSMQDGVRSNQVTYNPIVNCVTVYIVLKSIDLRRWLEKDVHTGNHRTRSKNIFQYLFQNLLERENISVLRSLNMLKPGFVNYSILSCACWVQNLNRRKCFFV